MKRARALSTVIFFLLAIAGCSGDDGDSESGNVTPATNPSLAGLWEAQTVSLAGSNLAPQPVPSGDIYLNFTNVAPSSVTSTLYAKLGSNNCLSITGPERLVATGSNQYVDSAGDSATFVVSGNSLDATLSANGSVVNIAMNRIVGLSVTDLPVCRGSRSLSFEPDLTLIDSVLSLSQ